MSDIIGHNEPLKKIACNTCKNYSRDKVSNGDYPCCKAFDKIPNDILSGDNMHMKPLPDQKNNVVYEPENK
jgi:hypothetical protein